VKKVILSGYSGHGKVASEIIMSLGHSITGYLESEKKTNNPHNLAFLGIEEPSHLMRWTSSHLFFVALGNNFLRQRIYLLIKSYGGEFVNAIHPTTQISKTAEIGDGVFLGVNAIINSATKIECGTIINSSATVEHDCNIGSFVHIAPGAVLAGGVKIGANAFVGANSTIKEGVVVGNSAIIGAGSVVLTDVPDNSTFVGNPAKELH